MIFLVVLLSVCNGMDKIQDLRPIKESLGPIAQAIKNNVSMAEAKESMMRWRDMFTSSDTSVDIVVNIKEKI